MILLTSYKNLTTRSFITITVTTIMNRINKYIKMYNLKKLKLVYNLQTLIIL